MHDFSHQATKLITDRRDTILIYNTPEPGQIDCGAELLVSLKCHRKSSVLKHQIISPHDISRGGGSSLWRLAL